MIHMHQKEMILPSNYSYKRRYKVEGHVFALLYTEHINPKDEIEVSISECFCCWLN